MKILFLSRYQNRVIRGAENFVEELSKRIGKYHEVEILFGKDADNLHLILRKKPDVIIPINGRWQVIKVSLGRLFGGNYKILITGHSGIGRDDIINLVVGKPDVFVALTTKAKIWAQKYAWGTRVIKFPNGVDIKKFTPQGPKKNLGLTPPIILSVGALEWYKYHEKVIEAVSLLNNGSLVIVGDGSQKTKLEKLGQRKLGNRCKIIQMPYSDMPSIYRSVDVFTLPSWDREAFGIVYLEAMATNLPVVAPNDSSRREIIEEAGVYVDVDSPSEYAKGLTEALSRNWENTPRKQAEKFNWPKIAAEYNQVLLELEKQ